MLPMSLVKQNPMWQHGYGSSFVLRSFVSLGMYTISKSRFKLKSSHIKVVGQYYVSCDSCYASSLTLFRRVFYVVK